MFTCEQRVLRRSSTLCSYSKYLHSQSERTKVLFVATKGLTWQVTAFGDEPPIKGIATLHLLHMSSLITLRTQTRTRERKLRRRWKFQVPPSVALLSSGPDQGRTVRAQSEDDDRGRTKTGEINDHPGTKGGIDRQRRSSRGCTRNGRSVRR